MEIYSWIFLLSTITAETLTNWKKYEQNFLFTVVSIDASTQKVNTLKGIEKYANIPLINLCDNQITSLEYIQFVINVEVLMLDHNFITSINNLKYLNKLNKLILSSNQIYFNEFFMSPLIVLIHFKKLNSENHTL